MVGRFSLLAQPDPEQLNEQLSVVAASLEAVNVLIGSRAWVIDFFLPPGFETVGRQDESLPAVIHGIADYECINAADLTEIHA